VCLDMREIRAVLVLGPRPVQLLQPSVMNENGQPICPFLSLKKTLRMNGRISMTNAAHVALEMAEVHGIKTNLERK
jgi:hypothetical protein